MDNDDNNIWAVCHLAESMSFDDLELPPSSIQSKEKWRGPVENYLLDNGFEYYGAGIGPGPAWRSPGDLKNPWRSYEKRVTAGGDGVRFQVDIKRSSRDDFIIMKIVRYGGVDTHAEEGKRWSDILVRAIGSGSFATNDDLDDSLDDLKIQTAFQSEALKHYHERPRLYNAKGKVLSFKELLEQVDVIFEYVAADMTRGAAGTIISNMDI